MKTHPILPWVLIGGIAYVLFFGLVSLLIGPRVTEIGDDLPFSRSNSILVTVLLLLIGMSNVVIVPWLVLPQAAKQEKATPGRIAYVGFSFAVAPSIYGVVVVVCTGQRLLALPFLAIALVGISVIYPQVKRIVSELE